MSPRPNLVLFMPDQLRADCVGAFGNPVAQTPNLDAFAASGTRFADAYSQHSVCGPSRVSLLTGWYPHVAGHRTLTNLLKPWEPNLLKLLKESGYNVAWVGARGDAFAPGVTETSTDFYGFTVKPNWREQGHGSPDDAMARAHYIGKRPEPIVDFDEATIQTAEAWLADAPREPWVLFVALVFPHPPFKVEDPWYSQHDPADMPSPAPRPTGGPRFVDELVKRHGFARLSPADWAEIARTYYGMVSRVDDQFGRVMRAVERAGAASNTVTAFCSDHGEYLGDYGLVEKWPSGLHDCLVRNPLMLAGPGVTTSAVRAEPVELIDLFATLLELAEVDVAHTHFGRSLLTGQARTMAFSEGGFTLAEEPLLEQAGFPYDQKAALQHDDPASVGRAISVRTDAWSYVYRLYEDDELYERATDPRELVNRAQDPALANVVREMRDAVMRWSVETSDVIPWVPDPRF